MKFLTKLFCRIWSKLQAWVTNTIRGGMELRGSSIGTHQLAYKFNTELMTDMSQCLLLLLLQHLIANLLCRVDLGPGHSGARD